jgi:hypothetical protein
MIMVVVVMVMILGVTMMMMMMMMMMCCCFQCVPDAGDAVGGGDDLILDGGLHVAARGRGQVHDDRPRPHRRHLLRRHLTTHTPSAVRHTDIRGTGIPLSSDRYTGPLYGTPPSTVTHTAVK